MARQFPSMELCTCFWTPEAGNWILGHYCPLLPVGLSRNNALKKKQLSNSQSTFRYSVSSGPHDNKQGTWVWGGHHPLFTGEETEAQSWWNVRLHTALCKTGVTTQVSSSPGQGNELNSHVTSEVFCGPVVGSESTAYRYQVWWLMSVVDWQITIICIESTVRGACTWQRYV